MPNCEYKNLGLIDYKEAWDLQENLLQQVVSARGSTSRNMGYLIICEHPHVYTLGRSGAENNLLANNEVLAKVGATFHRTNRGGDITYHGPGQVVCYPILDLQTMGIGIKEYVSRLEESVIETLKFFNLASERLDGASGVWIEPGVTGKERKICAIGVRASHFVTMHGLALNVNTDLNYFNLINPCGFTTKGVTSMQRELGGGQDMAQVVEVLRNNIVKNFNLEAD